MTEDNTKGPAPEGAGARVLAWAEDMAIVALMLSACVFVAAMWGTTAVMALIFFVALGILFLITFRWKD